MPYLSEEQQKQLPLDKDLFFDVLQICSTYQVQKDVLQRMEVLNKKDFRSSLLSRLQQSVKTKGDIKRVRNLLELLSKTTNVEPLKEVIPDLKAIFK